MADGHPLIDYPTGYVFKVVGRFHEGYPDFVRRIVSRALGRAVEEDRIRKLRLSSRGTYLAVTLEVVLIGESERQAVYRALWANEAVIFYL